MRICENGIYRDATPEEIAEMEASAAEQPEPTIEEKAAAFDILMGGANNETY